MVTLARNQPLAGREPRLLIDAGLAPGTHRFQLEAIDSAGLRSRPDVVSVVVQPRGIVRPPPLVVPVRPDRIPPPVVPVRPGGPAPLVAPVRPVRAASPAGVAMPQAAALGEPPASGPPAGADADNTPAPRPPSHP